MSAAQSWWFSVGLLLIVLGTALAVWAILVEIRGRRIETPTTRALRAGWAAVLVRLRRLVRRPGPTQTVQPASTVSATTCGEPSIFVEVIRADETDLERIERESKRRDEAQAQESRHWFAQVAESRQSVQDLSARIDAKAEADEAAARQIDGARLDLALWGLVLVAIGGACQAVSGFLA